MNKTKPRLTIGMPHYEDFDGAVFSIQSLLLHQDLIDTEILVIDNSPGTEMGKSIETFCGAHRGIRNVKYIAMPGNIGPSGAKNAVFENATADAVLCMDCHVLLPTGTVRRLIDFYEANPNHVDLVTGPLVYDNLVETSTQFDNIWRGEMWGIWGDDPRGRDMYAEPFEIWGQGCGLFSCRKEAWLGFNPEFRGFGGEEGYIHEKYRKAGRKTMCHPWLRWWHRFGRPGGVKYDLSRWNKVRNYVIGHQELGMSLDPIYEHFVKTGLMPQAEWDYLLINPIKNVDPLGSPPKAGSGKGIEDLFASHVKVESDVSEHLPKLREMASQCERIEEITRRRASTVALLSAQPASLRTHVHEIRRQTVADLAKVNGRTAFSFDEIPGHASVEIQDCDMLFFKSSHDSPTVAADLSRWAPKVSRWIAIHDTSTHGLVLDNRNRGYGLQINDFLASNKDWFIASHDHKQWGLTVLGKLDKDRPTTPVDPWGPAPAKAPVTITIPKEAPVGGPGTELGKLLSDIGIVPNSTCGCKQLSADMDKMGAANCRLNMDRIVEAITKNQKGWGWAEQLAAAAKALRAGYLTIKSMVEEAIKRTEANQKKDSEGKLRIACICPTYGRPELLRNSLACFLGQDYPVDSRRLIILDDAGQFANQEGAGWKIVSTNERIKSLAEKHDRLIELDNGWADAFAVWDDDEVFLPWHLSTHAKVLEKNEWSKSKKILFTNGIWKVNRKLPKIEDADGRFHASIAYRRSLYEKVGGYRGVVPPDKLWVSDFDLRMIAAMEKASVPGRPDELAVPSCVHRWESTGAYHSSQFSKDDDPEWFSRVPTPVTFESPLTLSPQMDEETVEFYKVIRSDQYTSSE